MGGQRRSYIQLFFLSKLYNGGNFYTILTTNLYDKSQTKVPYGLVCTIYIDNIQKAVIICLIISTFPFDAGSRVDNVRHTSGYFFMLDPASKGNIVGFTYLTSFLVFFFTLVPVMLQILTHSNVPPTIFLLKYLQQEIWEYTKVEFYNSKLCYFGLFGISWKCQN